MRELQIVGQIVVSSSQMYAAEKWVIKQAGLGSLVLMEIAARAVADAVIASGRSKPLFLCGVGNNGADGVAAARYLIGQGYISEIFILGDKQKLSSEMQTQLETLRAFGGTAEFFSDDEDISSLENALQCCDVVIDGIFGIGLSRPLGQFLQKIVGIVNDSSCFVVAIDLPTGVDADNGQVLPVSITADTCVTFQYLKYGHVITPGRAHCGQVQVIDIGIPKDYSFNEETTEVLNSQTTTKLLGVRPLDAHKGTFGHLLVLAGCPDKPGAAYLACKSALRSGVGLVTLGSTEQTIGRLASVFVEVMGMTLGKNRIEPHRLPALFEQYSAVVVGPALEPDSLTVELVRSLISYEKPLVVDAGALSALQENRELRQRNGPTILTPHPGEAARLLGCSSKDIQSDRLKYGRRLAQEFNAYVVLKGAGTFIVSPKGKSAVCLEGNAGMATGGTGDVLAGVIGSLLAQRIDPWLAVCFGVRLHAFAGDEAAKVRSPSALIASDLIEYLR